MRPMLTKSISRCTSDRKPRLLVCLHSACQECFQSKLAEARREESGADEVFIDGDSAPFVPEVRIIIRYFWLRLNICVVCGGNCLTLKCLLIEFVIPNLSKNYFCCQKICKTNVLNRVWVQNQPWNLCSRVVNLQMLICENGVKWSY